MSDEMIHPSWQDAAERTMVAYEAEKALADELYAKLDELIPDDGVLGPSVAEVKARYRKARSRWPEVKARADAALARHRKRHDG
jgi:hypothetical protein